MKIATWNLQRPVREESARREGIARWLGEIDADVWVLTETHAEIGPGADYTGVATEVSDRKGEDGENWTTIWSRFPIRRLDDTEDPARAVAALIEPPGQTPMVVYGTVLPWLGSKWEGVPGVGGQAYRAASGAQLSDWLRLRDDHPDSPLWVIGDLNQDLSDKHYYGSKANRTALADVIRRGGLVCLTADPNDPVRAIAPDHAAIDHICVDAGFAGVATARLRAWPEGPAPDRGVSDHFGVVAEIG